MPDALLASLSGLAGWLLTYLLHSSALIAAAWLITTVGSLGPATRDAVWKTALLGGVVTATAAVLSVGSAVDLLTIRDRGTVAGRLLGASSEDHGRWVSDGPVAVRREIRVRVVEPDDGCRQALHASALLEPGWKAGVAETCASSAGLRTHVPLVGLLVLWLVGATLGVGRWAGRRLALRPVVRALGPADERSHRLLASLVRRRGTWLGPSPRLRVSQLLASPCVLPGAIIALPRRCELELSDAELGAVLAHEWAHVVRRDVLWSGLLRIVAAIAWIQPLNRWALDRLGDAMEESCDDWALRRTGERLGLARSISLVAEWSLASTVPAPRISMGGRTRSGAAERVARILAGDRRGPESGWLRGALIGTLLAPMYWMPSVPPPAAVVPMQAIFIEERAMTAVRPLDAPGDTGVVSFPTGADGQIHDIVPPPRRD